MPTLNGVGNVTGVLVIVTQSPSVVNAEVTEYAVIMRITSEVRGPFLRVTMTISRRCKGSLRARHKHPPILLCICLH